MSPRSNTSSSISRRGWLRGIAAGAGGLMLAPLLTRIAAAGPGPVRRFVFVVEGNCFEPVTLLGDDARRAIDATLAAPIDTARWWPNRYRHGAPLEITAGLSSAPALGDNDVAVVRAKIEVAPIARQRDRRPVVIHAKVPRADRDDDTLSRLDFDCGGRLGTAHANGDAPFVEPHADALGVRGTG